ncbi:hypothetical protein BZG35_14200 [Brevundimonas sp. LM2]|uniref:GH3 auxin-responsive promoter family protein n=1 Tax=Brevundimonas sp. LM2 TaxID=1938605 RepID=UPI000983D9C2|nr:GH3 auxin-responsive promoter family protein [Brevundimonas sp. LM2]AQR62670.1 hypothetical protein BZG35_14200 [Brevundimonas sp. LM2]
MRRRASDSVSRLTFEAAMATQGRAALDALMRPAADPRRAQAETLRRILAAHRDTGFGRAHDYGALRTFDDFRRAVPIRDYEGLRPWIERQIATGEPALTAETPLMYARTSGTTGLPKLIPVTPDALDRLRRAQRAGAYVQHRAGRLFAGRILALVGAMREDSLADGTPIGSATGLIYASMPWVVRSRYVVPPAVFAIEDADVKYRIVTRLALQHPDLSAVSTANPSTLLRLRDTSRQHWADFLTQIAAGTCPDVDGLPDAQKADILAAIRPEPGRAAALDRAAQAGEPTIAQLWPRLAGVVTWTGGSCAMAAEAVADALAPGVRLMEAGYVCSEFRGTIVVDAAQDFGLPLLDDVVFEFVPSAAWDEGSRETLLIDELEEGQAYQVIVTTVSGLARYQLNDVLAVGPRIGATPSLKFLRKGRGTTSITGEKLTEDQVMGGVARLARALSVQVPFHMVLADEATATYTAYLELDGEPDTRDAAAALDRALAELNIEYAAKRATGRLGPVRVAVLRPGAGAAYRSACVAAGQRDAQFKVLALQHARDCAFDFTAWRLPDAGHPSDHG